ncbi:MAG: hypothetical protein IKW76_13875 [Clostridia bacterium]|nr:hypothetical protein [Clostridia bacterium]
MSITAIEEKLNELFEELVPATGKADTLAGEIVRSICRIGYRNYNDGDHLGVGYGKETCNPAGRFLAQRCDDKVARCVRDAWGIISDTLYDAALERLETAVLEYLDAHPDLKTAPNTEDMWDCYDRYEDVDDSEDDEYYDDDDDYDDDDEDWD